MRHENARKWSGETAHNFARIARILTSLAPMKSPQFHLFSGATTVTSSAGDVPLGFHLIRRFQGGEGSIFYVTLSYPTGVYSSGGPIRSVSGNRLWGFI